jgi:hypothetical protein
MAVGLGQAASRSLSTDGTTFTDVFDQSGCDARANVSPGAAVGVTKKWAGIKYLKVRSGTRDAPVPQRRDVAVTIMLGDARDAAE